MTTTAFTPSGQVILAACGLAQDPGASRLTKPFYEAALRDAVIELCMDTNWDIRSVDKYIPENRIITLPNSFHGLRVVYAFNGEDENIQDTTEVHLKPNYTHGGGTGFFARQKGINVDGEQGNTFVFAEPWNMYYCGIQGKKMYLSPQVKERFSKVRIVFQGLGQCDECTVPSVPTWAVEAVKYWIAHRACELRQREGALFVRLVEQYGEQLTNPRLAWTTAKMRYKRMDYKQRQDANMYNNRIGFGPL